MDKAFQLAFQELLFSFFVRENHENQQGYITSRGSKHHLEVKNLGLTCKMFGV